MGQRFGLEGDGAADPGEFDLPGGAGRNPHRVERAGPASLIWSTGAGKLMVAAGPAGTGWVTGDSGSPACAPA